MRKSAKLPEFVKTGVVIEVNTASGWLKCEVIDVKTGLVEQVYGPTNMDWKRFYIGDRGVRKI